MSLLGTWAYLNANAFPFTMHPFVVFIVITSGRGNVPLRLELLSGDEQATLQSGEATVELPDPTAIREIGFGLPPTLFPQAGVYRVNIWSGKELLASRRLPVQMR